jgi:hypothetical protein
LVVFVNKVMALLNEQAWGNLDVRELLSVRQVKALQG